MLNKRLLRLVPGIYNSTVKAVVFQWLSLVCNILIIAVICNFLNYSYLYKNIDYKIMVKSFFVIIVCVLLRGLFTKINVKITSHTAQKAKKILREKIFDKICEIGISYKNNISTAEAVQVSVEGIEQLEIYFSQYIPQLFYSIISVLTIFIVFSFFNIKTALVFLICVPIIPVSIMLVQRFAKKLLSKYWNSYTSLGDTFLENIQGLTTLKIYNCDDKKHIEMNKNAELFRKATMRVLIMQLNSIAIMDIVAFGGAAVGIIISLIEFSRGNINFLQSMFIILLSSEFFIPLRQLGSFFHVAMNGAAAAEKIFRILDINKNKVNTDNSIIENSEIEFNGVSFSYDNNIVLKDINLKFKNNGLFAIVGKSGCGKSTIASILTGRLKDYKGSIKIGNKELNTFSEKKLMNTITFVSHNSHIFKGSVEYNLKMGNENATKEEMLLVLEMVNLVDFINSENGLKTEILEQGSNLSGGQKQRLAIARALLHNTPIYIFDEATSNIDAESEEDIINIITKIAEYKSVILISHRLANGISSNMISVLKNGVIIAEGLHKELMAYENHYSELYLKQQSLEKYLSGGDKNE